MNDASVTRISASLSLFAAVWRYRHLLRSTALIELRQRYAGSLLGSVWILLYPLLFLSIYLFLYLVIFRMRFPGYSQLNFVVFVFSGLVPYLVIMESITRGASVIKENIHLVKNVIMPIELVPVRLVLVSFLGHTMSFVLLIALALVDGDLSWRVIFLPIVVLLVAMFVIGVVYFVSSAGALVNDIGHLVNLTMIALLFVSPIAFKPDMVPLHLKIVVYANPVSYLLEGVRWCVLDSHVVDPVKLALFPVLAILTFMVGAGFFRRFKGLIADHV